MDERETEKKRRILHSMDEAEFRLKKQDDLMKDKMRKKKEE